MPIISLQISQDLMDQFDQIQKELGFNSRSEALREAILTFLRINQDKTGTEGHRIATITVYHDVREDIMNTFSELIAEYDDIVKSVHQYNLKKTIIKVLITAGEGIEIQDLYKKLTTDKNFFATISYVIIPDLEIGQQEEPEAPA
jgi:CopG family nickel-responsive transcriptional regulator